jgi:murein DD-endopeptidase MepM/ murein hydrolase activator NlpD
MSEQTLHYIRLSLIVGFVLFFIVIIFSVVDNRFNPTWLISEGRFGRNPLPIDQLGIVAERFDYPVDLSAEGWQLPYPFEIYNYTAGIDSYHAGEDWSRWRDGVNISQGQPIYAAATGLVRYADMGAQYPGGVIIIEHLLPNGEVWYSLYGHLGEISVSQNETVSLGQPLGTLYEWISGLGNNSHLHFEIREFYLSDPVNGSNPLSPKHSNFPPGPGYWPVGSARGSGQMPLDLGWVDPSAFIEAHR